MIRMMSDFIGISIYFFFVLVLIERSDCITKLERKVRYTSDLCDSGSIDAITIDTSNRIQIFVGKYFWILDKDLLYGPCNTVEIFQEFKGPLDAALTITQHKNLDSIIGVSIFFFLDEFFIFKYYNAYEVNYGSIIHIPHRGLKKVMGMASETAQSLWKLELVSAYFDPNYNTSNYILSNGSALSFDYESSYEFDKPVISTLQKLLSKYGVIDIEPPIDAILTFQENKSVNQFELLLFKDGMFCKFKLIPDQSCIWKPVKAFFLKCPAIDDKQFCESLRVLPTDQTNNEITRSSTQSGTGSQTTGTKRTTTSTTSSTGDIEYEVSSSTIIRFSQSFLINFIVLKYFL